MVKEKRALWTGQHKDTCVNKDEAGFYEVKARVVAFNKKKAKPKPYKSNCAECGAPFVHNQIEIEYDLKGREIGRVILKKLE